MQNLLIFPAFIFCFYWNVEIQVTNLYFFLFLLFTFMQLIGMHMHLLVNKTITMKKLSVFLALISLSILFIFSCQKDKS